MPIVYHDVFDVETDAPPADSPLTRAGTIVSLTKPWLGQLNGRAGRYFSLAARLTGSHGGPDDARRIGLMTEGIEP